eukprot:1294737-Rhodomonas_salina.5
MGVSSGLAATLGAISQSPVHPNASRARSCWCLALTHVSRAFSGGVRPDRWLHDCRRRCRLLHGQR